MKTIPALLTAVLAVPALAQQGADPAHPHAWSENVGWTTWAGFQGSALFNPNILSGNVWFENAGWLTLGDGIPANGTGYANQNGADAGVNILADDRLAGLAWGENIGWVNFGPFASLPAAQQARLDRSSARLRGYAWGENVGWLNLDDADDYVGTACPVDFNCDGFLDFFDYDDFVATFEGGTPPPCRADADFNGDGFVDFFDYDDFVAAFEAGC